MARSLLTQPIAQRLSSPFSQRDRQTRRHPPGHRIKRLYECVSSECFW
ncbi:hypothetical protein H6F86_20415 [Phormidium sp. FACHB-592]|uniref:Uncharacterized protein n=1 Tax=Stenomitos frigidus AS-A4 TaxID=2933935 RepID=A0ABV0KEU6_9CYAN|nr:hypothetical protein [Phormidium sp. FACHB-592]MBD2076196.1 hypothetical protein [Phormidium sp. FACHB-592]